MSQGLPTVMLEQNVVPGRVTRWLASSITSVCAGFERTRSYFPSSVPLVVTGNPARPAFERLYRQTHSALPLTSAARPSQAPEMRLVVIGGAGGARSLNRHMPKALAQMGNQLEGWQVVHQSGEGQLQETERRYREAGVDALVVAFIDEMASVMFASDLVVCRAAGTTLAELALAGVPAVLVPYPPAMDCQLSNAEVFAASGAATIIDETALTGTLADALVAQLEPLMRDASRRATMAAAMRQLARPDAASNVTDAIQHILCGTSARLAA
jgi:UDP-N-acetylglucosamine--N-acetylmuramyl-(pentapeptide) pyrophosphoryl-undecaprenol N-acetylglucosamine transferase